MPTDGVQYNGMPLNDYLKKLDAQDGKVDGKIESSVWNEFSETLGGQRIRQGETMAVFQAEGEASPILSGDTPKLRSKQEDIRSAASLISDSGYSVSGEMLRIALTPEALKIGNHAKDGYTVVSPDVAQKKLKALGLKEGQNDHMSAESMRLKMVEFKPNSAVAKGLSNSGVVKSLVQNWYNQGGTSSEPIDMNTFDKKNWNTADDADTAFGVGYSYLVGLHDNGDGTVSGYVEDVYDFSPKYNGDSGGVIDKLTGEMLSHVCELQDVGKVQNYRTLTPITIRVTQKPKKDSWSEQIKDKIRPYTTQKQRESLSGVASAGSAVVNTMESVVKTTYKAGNTLGEMSRQGYDYAKQKGKQAWNALKSWF